MRVTVEQIGREKEEQVLIQCHEVTESIREIERSSSCARKSWRAMTRTECTHTAFGRILCGSRGQPPVYLYGKKVYELKMKLYTFEENYCSGEFFRCSRTAVVNLMRVSYLRPGLNGRLSARLTNGEDIIISRKYVNALKARLQNE